MTWKTAWITGASSGIGRELSLQLAAEGVLVAASARREALLFQLSTLNSNIVPFPVDVCDRVAMGHTIRKIVRKFGGIELAILNAGMLQDMGVRDYDAGMVARLMTVNYCGIANALEGIIPVMRRERTGQIGLVGSLAGYHGRPWGAAYAPTKAAIICLAECLLQDLLCDGIQISIINPGIVDTPMTAHIGGQKMPVDAAAEHILSGLRKRQFEIAFPLTFRTRLHRLLPNPIYWWRAQRRARAGLRADLPPRNNWVSSLTGKGHRR